jgi:uncharacterized protein (TIGR03437 family)
MLCPAALLGMLCVSASAQTTPTCTVSAATASVAASGLTEKMPDIVISCFGGTSGLSAIGAIYITLNTGITNTLDENGAPEGVAVNTTGATVAMGSPALAGSMTLQILNVNYVVPTPSSTPVKITVGGLRAAVGTVQNGLPNSQVTATVLAPGFTLLNSRMPIAVGTASLQAAIINNGISCAGSPVPSRLDFPSFISAGTLSSAVRVTEALPKEFAVKDSSTISGTRIIVRMTGYGSGIRLFVPDALVGNSGTAQTSAGQFGTGVQSGIYTPSSGQLLLSRVSGADENGLGGQVVTSLPTSQKTFTAVSELDVSSGSAYAVYEVLDGRASSTESFQAPVFIANNPNNCGNALEANLSVEEGPISTVAVATATDPLPRYIHQALGSDCQHYGDCNAVYFPVLSVGTDPIKIAGSSLGNPQTASIPISNTGGSQLNMSISISYQSGSGWLTATPVSDRGALSLSLVADPGALQPGTYNATVNIDAGSAGSAAVPVVFTVGQKGITIQAIVNAASYQPGALAPGAYVAIFGHDLLGVDAGASTPVVTFDGLTAEVIYTSATQFNLIVPPSLTAQNSANVQIKVGSEVSNAVKVTLTPNMPGIFTPGMVNSDGSVNSSTASAARGDFVSIYMTGLAFPAIPGTITVTMGGQTGIVPLFAGPQPTYPALDQINVTIPASLDSSGGSVPVSVCVTTIPGIQPVCSNSVSLYIR